MKRKGHRKTAWTTRCPRCNERAPTDAGFCPDCGAKLVTTCERCRTSNAASYRYCKACGSPLQQTAAKQSGGKGHSTQQVPPPYPVEGLLNAATLLEGERKQVTVLFADIKGSLEILTDRDPEEARRFLDAVVERMVEAVHEYEGLVNQVLGDGIMALFGAPVAHENHAIRACYAALRMHERVAAYAEHIRSTEGLDLQIRVGLNSGEVVVHSVHTDLSMDYNAIGETTHLAARMEQLARPGATLLTPDTFRLSEGYIQVRALGAVPVKGLNRALSVYELTGAVKVRSRLQATAARGLSPFLGRTDEMRQLTRALERVRSGHGQLVAVVGELGVGKSRLFYEFVRGQAHQKWLVLESTSLSQGRVPAYHALVDLLRGYFKIDSRDDLRSIQAKVTGVVLTLDDGLRRVVPPLLALLDALPPASPFERLDPVERRQRTVEATRALLLRESLVQPVCLVFEDLHTMDPQTLAFLGDLIGHLSGAHILLLLNYRPDFEHAWGGRAFSTQLRLDPLIPADSQKFLETLLGNDPSLESVKRVLVERTDGNPFFLEESVRALLETHALSGEPGRYQLVHSPLTIQVPETVHAVLAARIDRLPPETKRLLQSAAVIGKDVPFVLLREVGGLPDDELRQQVALLRSAEFLYEASLFPDLELTFTHAMTHEVAYGSILHERRRTLHAAIMAAIEKVYGDRLPEHVDRLSHHALRGERWGPAVTYLRQATEKALGRPAIREAVAYAQQTLDALSHLPENVETIGHAIDSRLDLRSAYLALQDLERVGECLTEAEALADRINDELRLGRIAGFRSGHSYLSGRLAQAVEHAERAIALAERLERPDLQVVPRIHLAQALHAVGRNRDVLTILEHNVDYLAGPRARERYGMPGLPSVISRGWMAIAAAELGLFDRSSFYGREARLLSDSFGGPFDLIHINTSLAFALLRQGSIESAIALAEVALETCRAQNLPHMVSVAASHLGYGYALSGRIDEGLPLLAFAVQQSSDVKIQAGKSVWEARLAEGYLLAGRVSEALELAEGALLHTQQYGEAGYEGYAERALGLAHAAAKNPEEAESHFRRAMELAQTLELSPLAAHCLLGVGRAQMAAGKAEPAARNILAATEAYRALQMSRWLADAEESLAGLPHGPSPSTAGRSGP
jgi:class 3 adenylate cyclase/tetratricopeptide (TPR) repeat protein